MPRTRFQFDVKEARVPEVRALMKDIGAESNKELFDNALTLLEWAVGEVKSGNTIASVNESKQMYRELQMPALRHAASKLAEYPSAVDVSAPSQKVPQSALLHGLG